MAEGLFSKGYYSVERSGIDATLVIDCKKAGLPPSIEDSPQLMTKVVQILSENTDVVRIVLSQNRDYEYDDDQTMMLREVGTLYRDLSRSGEFSQSKSASLKHLEAAQLMSVKNAVFNLLPSDPIGAYVDLTRRRRHEQITYEGLEEGARRSQLAVYIGVLEELIGKLEKTTIIKRTRSELSGFEVGSREVYRRIFTPTIKPDFMFTKLMASYPADAEELDTYTIDDETEVTVFQLAGSVQTLYHIIPPEFKLSEEKYALLDQAKKIISEYKPQRQDFIDPQRIRMVFYNIAHDLLEELKEFNHLDLSNEDLDLLARILVRYTIGFGLLEILLTDPEVQDITLNSPEGKSPIFLVHARHGDCLTNLLPTKTETESWASKFRLLSGRPLDEANPILDTELHLPNANARVAIVAEPLNPFGLAYAFRRHRDKPWTLPLFLEQNMLSPMAAGLLSFLIDGSRTFLVAGTRSAGKTSLLGSFVTEIMRKYRIITVEDTLELPVSQLVELGFNIQQMKVGAALSSGTNELSAAEGIRTSLRMGDSGLIIGEVRSTEALALYESMRIGALANVVAGTIHGDSPYGVYDRVVNDLKVPKTSFKATDILVVANPVRTPDGLHKFRRVTSITEVRKHWENDPLAENGFVDLMRYNAQTDELEPTQDLINGDSDIVKSIAGGVKEWAGDWDAVWDNILLRAKMKAKLVEFAQETDDHDLLEADFVIRANDAYHTIADDVLELKGHLDSREIYFRWEDWLNLEGKRRRLRDGQDR